MADTNEDVLDEDPPDHTIYSDGVKMLLNGGEVFSGFGGALHSGDTSPVTIVGWSSDAKTLLCRAATSRFLTGGKNGGMQHYVYYSNPKGEVMVAEWRPNPEYGGGGQYYRVGSDNVISTNGYKRD
jgi:hypothetical protein